MDDFKKLTEQLLKIYINAGSVNNLGIENYFDENISLIGTGKHELFTNLHEFLESFKFDVKRRGKIRLEVRNLHQEEERLDDDHVLAHGTGDFIGLFKDGIRYCLLSYLKAELKNKEDRTCQKISRNGYGY